jgi:hypothetical protein
MCNVYQEPLYPLFFAAANGGRQLIKYPDYVDSETGACTKKNYRFAPLQRQYAKLAYAIKFEVVQKIDHLLGPTALTGSCCDAQGHNQNSGVVVLNRGLNFGPEPELQQECLKMCQDYEHEKGIELQGCEPIWRHGGRGCYAFKTEVTQISGVGRRRACFVDPIRPEQFEETCTYLNDLVDNIYNYARTDAVMESTGKINAEYCTNGEDTFAVTADLVTLLTTIKNAAAYHGATPIPVIIFVYIVADHNDNVVGVRKVASNNPALHPVLTDDKDEYMEGLCTNTGGEVAKEQCCDGVNPFPSQISIGACECSPEDSTETDVCDCSGGLSFDTTWGCVDRIILLGCQSTGDMVYMVYIGNCSTDEQAFPDAYMIDECECPPDDSETLLMCQYPDGMCWDG